MKSKNSHKNYLNILNYINYDIISSTMVELENQ